MLAPLVLACASARSSAAPYSEPLRPIFHFTAKSGWLNDPNGLVWANHEYHLFFQHNPFGPNWGNMTWGHAVSKDLVHWKQIANAILPDDLGVIYSGSVVVDPLNTAGFGAGASVCIYTAAGGGNPESKGKPFTICLAYSKDGVHYTKYAGNPVLPHIVGDNRDPKVIWYEPGRCWVMALYLEGSRYGLFTSPDLKHWTQTSTVDLKGSSECPDFFELPLDGKKSNPKWIFWGANGHYMVGSFDGKAFHPETQPIPSARGGCFYASQTYFNDPKDRRVQIGWMQKSEFPNMAWNQEMTFPTELNLVSTKAGPRLTFRPVSEIAALRGRRLKGSGGHFESPSGGMGAVVQLPAAGGPVSLEANGLKITYDPASRKLDAGGDEAVIADDSDHRRLRILIDRASVEMFGDKGLYYFASAVPPRPGPAVLNVSPSIAAAVSASALKNSWKQNRPHED